MELNVHSQNHFSFKCLPTLLFDHIVHYLDRRDRENMAQVNRYLRKVFNSPRLWKGIEIRLRKHDRKALDPNVLEMLRIRGITNLICDFKFELRIAALQPHLERLTLRNTVGRFTLQALCMAASNGYLNHLKSLELGSIGPPWPEKFLDLFKCLPMMEEVSIGSSGDVLQFSADGTSWSIDSHDGLFLTDEFHEGSKWKELQLDLKQALCYSGKLTSLSLRCFEEVGKSWLNTVMISNPHVQSLSLSLITTFSEGSDDAVDLAACSNLRTFQLTEIPRTGQGTPNKILSWAFPEDKPYENVTSLDLSSCHDPTIYSVLVKFPALKKLNLSDGVYRPNQEINFSLPNFQHLEWLELSGYDNLTGNGLLQLSENAGKNLQYLGLAWTKLKEDCLRSLPGMFPALRTLDLSGCRKLTDATMVEWYIKHDKSEWPKLRKLILKDSHAVTQDVVESVRLKTRNQLLIDYGEALVIKGLT